MKVRNLVGTTKNTCSCGSWLDHWRNHHPGIGVDFFCSHKECLKIDLIGAHVQIVDGVDKSWYIVPLCKKHNNTSEIFEVVSYATLVPAKKSETCNKKTIKKRKR